MIDIGKDLVNAYEEGMRDAIAKIDNEVFELQTEVKRLERICHTKAEVAMEIFEEIENWFELYKAIDKIYKVGLFIILVVILATYVYCLVANH